MKKSRNDRMALVLILGIVATFGSAHAGETIEQSRSTTADPRVEIENVINGSVTVRGWEKNEVSVTGTIGDEVEDFEMSGSEGRVNIELEYEDRNWHGSLDDSDLTIHVPVKAEVWVEGVNVEIEVSAVSGPLSLEVVNGSITVTGNPESIEASTVNGEIKIDAKSGKLEIESVSGSIEVLGAYGELSAETVSGSVEISGDAFKEVDATSVSGSVTFNGSLTTRGSFDFESHSGGVTLILPADVSAEFDISTFSGSIENELSPDRAERTSRYAPGKELRFDTGSGDAEVSVSSFSGTVRLKKAN